MTGAVIPAGQGNPELEVIERERFYDSEIAPALADLARRCEQCGLSFLALVEWDIGEVGSTGVLQRARGPQIDWANAAAHARGNADTMIMHIMRQAEKSGHSSMCLNILGVPPTAKADR